MATFRDDLARVGRKLREAVEERTGVELVPSDRLEVLEAAETSDRSARKMLEWLRFKDQTVTMQGAGGRMPTDMTPLARTAAAAQAQRAWMEDPMAGQQVDLYVSFVLGRGVPKPVASDPEVQAVLDACWDDPANKRILTSFDKLVEKAVDLAIQSNVFFTLFDDGTDGMVRVSLLTFEDVQDVVRHPKDKYRILQYRAIERPVKYDYKEGRYVTPIGPAGQPRNVFYEAWDAFDDDNPVMRGQDDAAGGRERLQPPKDKQRPGKVVHLAVNKTSEMAFGVPRMRRLTRWFAAYNETLESHVNRMKAMASIYMQAKVQGTQRDIDRIGQQTTGRRSAFGASQEVQPGAGPQAPMGPGVLASNQSLNFEPFKIDSGASDVAASSPIIRGQFSGAFPDSYMSGTSQGGVAGDQALELPTLKFIEREQEAWAGVFRTLARAAIDAAVENGDLTEWRDPTQSETEAILAAEETGDPLSIEIGEGGKVKRNLDFELSLPSPLKRAMGDLVGAAVETASAVDPNGDFPEMSRWLFGFILAQAFDVENPQQIVDQVLPRHLLQQKAEQAQQAAGIDPATGLPIDPAVATITGPDGKQHPPDNPGGGKVNAPQPEDRKVDEARRALDDAFDDDVLRVVEEHLEALREVA